jgi:hypothetical protein
VRPAALIAALLTTVALACATPISAPPAPVAGLAAAAGHDRLVVFISDLHLGVGRLPGGEWSAYEDFRWAPEFRQFLERVDREGGGRTDLVLNGDTFELWQSLEGDCVHGDRDRGCTEAEALRRLSRVVDQHRGELAALGAFAASGRNTVTIVPGNHDAALLFPAVADSVRMAIGAPAGRVTIPARGYWMTPDGAVYAEHGHQIGAEVNRFDGWPQPFLAGSGGRHLRRPWGEQFVQSYYNQVEAKYPIIDNISDERAAVRYAMTAEGGLSAAADSAEFIRFFLLGVSWRQFGASLKEEGAAPEWDVARIQREGGQRFVIESFAATDPVRLELQRRAQQAGLPLSAAALSPEEIGMICDQRAALSAQPGSGVLPCPRKAESLRAIAERLTRSRDQIFSGHLKKTSDDLGQTGRRFALFVYSHTHLVDEGFQPLRTERLGWNPRVVNTGAWQRVVSPATVGGWNLAPGDALRRTVDTLPECYSLIWVPPYTDVPVAQVRSWRTTTGGAWDFGPKCDG